MAMKVESKSKTALKAFFAFLVSCDGLSLLATLVNPNPVIIVICLLKLSFDGLVLVAIIKQWRGCLRICRVFLIIFYVMFLVGARGMANARAEVNREADMGILNPKSADENKEILKVENAVLWIMAIYVIIQLVIYGVSAKIMGNYTEQLKRLHQASNSGSVYPPPNAPPPYTPLYSF